MTDDITTAARPQGRSMAIKGLTPSLPERGKIKIGQKGAMRKSGGGKEFQPPQKLDHFVVTNMARGADGNFVRDDAIHGKLGAKPVEIPVRLIYDDPTLNFPTRYACYQGRKLWCAGDGETARRLTVDGKDRETVSCPCPRQDPAYTGADKCKMNGSLAVLIEGAPGVGGVWKFRTTSYNSIVGILSTMAFIRGVTGGPLGNIPLMLVVRPKQAADPSGQAQTIYVVSLEYRGDIDDLREKGHQIALDRATTHVSIQHIEEEARRLLLGAPDNAPLPGDDAEEVAEEFYPEQAAEGATIIMPPQAGRPASKLDALATVTAEPTNAEPAPASDDTPAPQDGPSEMDDDFPGDRPSYAVPLGTKDNGKPDYSAWLLAVADRIKAAPDPATLTLIANANGDILSDIRGLGPTGQKNHKWLSDVFDARYDELGGLTPKGAETLGAV